MGVTAKLAGPCKALREYIREKGSEGMSCRLKLYLKTILAFLNLTYIEEAICIFKKIVHFQTARRTKVRADWRSK